MKLPCLDQRPIVVAVAGPNGAGKTTFYHAHLKDAGLRFVNVDVLARELGLHPYAAAEVTQALRHALIAQHESFFFETVFSDPTGEKLAFLKEAAAQGYTVALCFVGVRAPEVCDERVAMRVSQDGHDVPPDKLATRFPRTLQNLRTAIRELPHVLVFDNDDLSRPFRLIASFADGHAEFIRQPVPGWAKEALMLESGRIMEETSEPQRMSSRASSGFLLR